MAATSSIINLPSSALVNANTPFTEFVLSRISQDDPHRLFVMSFAEHVRADPDAKVIDFNDVFRWIGYDRKDSAVRLLKRELNESEYIFYVKHNDVENLAGRPKEVYKISVNQFEELMIAAHTDEGKRARKMVLLLKRAVQDYMQMEIEQSRSAHLALQDENVLLKDQLKPRKNFFYMFKNNRDEPDHWCSVKGGSAEDADNRVKPYLQVSPKGLLVLVIEVPVQTEKELQHVEATVHRFLKYAGFFVGMSDRAETYIGDLERMKQIVRVVLDLHTIISKGQNWDTLQHVVALCNEELRDCPIDRPSSEPLALSELQQLRQHMQELVDIKSRPTHIPEPIIPGTLQPGPMMESETEEDESDSGSESGDIEETGSSSRAYDFDRFVRDCCDVGEEYEVINMTITGRHKVWSRCLSKDIHNKLTRYLKTRFASVRIAFEGKCLHGFGGLRVRPSEFNHTEVPTQTYQFLTDCCVDAPQGKLPDFELRAKFIEWRGEETDAMEAELREVQKYLKANYPHNLIWIPDLKKSDYGFYGVSLRGLENRYIRRMPSTTSRPVLLLDGATGRPKRRWEKVADAATALGLSSASISYSIRHNKVREGGYLKYENDLQ